MTAYLLRCEDGFPMREATKAEIRASLPVSGLDRTEGRVIAVDGIRCVVEFQHS